MIQPSGTTIRTEKTRCREASQTCARGDTPDDIGQLTSIGRRADLLGVQRSPDLKVAVAPLANQLGRARAQLALEPRLCVTLLRS